MFPLFILSLLLSIITLKKHIEQNHLLIKKNIDFKNQTGKLPDEKTLNFKDIEFPFKYKDIPKFEKLNQIFTVNVFGTQRIYRK